MKHPVVIALFMMVIALPVVPVFAAELLDVKPVVAGSDLTVEIRADIPMTYTYYKIPGQARAVVDIADADPEKIEPLIVVNKGAVSSISVDKAQIAGMAVSRLIFNLVSDADIFATASADRKKLSITFGAGKPANGGSEKPVTPLAEPAPAPLSAPVGVPAEAAPAVTQKEADPLGLDEPSAAPAKSEPTAAPKETAPLGLDETIAVPAKREPATKVADVTVVTAVAPRVAPVPTAFVKLEPVVPAGTLPHKPMVITAIKVGTSYVEIEANNRLEVFEQMKLAQPNRLAIDVPGATSSLSTKSITVRRFGLEQVRIGRYPDHVRIVLDAGSSPFPDYQITSTEKGLRVSFK